MTIGSAKEKKHKISEFSGYLTGSLLVAMPHISDARFHKSLVFVCGHDENGAMGLVVNRVLEEITLKDLFQQMNMETSPVCESYPIHFGGPVEGGKGFVLHTADYQQATTLVINDQYGVTATLDILSAIAEEKGPKFSILALGYAGWGPGQLDAELQSNNWLEVEPDENLIFQVPYWKKWEAAISKLGIEEMMLTPDLGHA
ncbi:MAG: YqgE/AlgH family protein [Alphaproteobacteria bacterium]